MQKRYKHQEEGINFIVENNGSGALYYDCGLGKAQPFFSNILTDNGYIQLQNLKVGDKVANNDGNFYKVKRIFDKGIREIYRVEFSDGSVTHCCDEHLWDIQSNNNRARYPKEFKTVQLKDLDINLYYGKDRKSKKYFIQITKPINFKHKKLPLEPYFLGILLGNGILSKSSIELSTNENEHVLYLKSKQKKYNFYIRKANKYDYYLSSNNEVNEINKILKILNLKCKSIDKFIPDIYKYSSIKQRIAILQGLLDTDGSCHSKSFIVEYSSSSEKLCDDVKFLVQSLGGKAVKSSRIPKYTYKGIKKEGHIAYRLNISMPPNITPFLLPRKIKKYIPRTKYKPCRAFNKIEYIGKYQSYCISVDSPNNLYLTDECIVTHNTLMALDIFSKLREKNNSLKLIVICPLTLIHNAWTEDIGKFTSYMYQDLHGLKNWKNLQNVDIYLMNYEMMLSKTKVDAILSYLKQYTLMCVLDESSKIKNPRSATTKKILSISPSFRYRVLMSGTPAPNDETEYWAQMRFINPDIFSKSFYTFRNNYFHLQRGNQIMSVPNGTVMSREMARNIFSKGFKYFLNDNNRKALLDKMKPYVIFRKLEDCIDLPEQTHIIREVELTGTQAKEYVSMKKDLVAKIQGQYITAPFALTKISKLRQITSGFVINAEQQPINFPENAKLDELKELLEELGDKQCIIWAWFTHEIETIHQLYKDKSLIINGTVTDIEKTEAINKFKRGEVQYLIANPLSIAHGVTLTNCAYCIYYSLSYSWEQLSQSISRIHRISQKNACFYYYLLCKDTIDEIIYKVLTKKGKEEDIVKELLK